MSRKMIHEEELVYPGLTAFIELAFHKILNGGRILQMIVRQPEARPTMALPIEEERLLP
ncbi:MAG: hypothetical protein QM757_38150 [Paludibaculum sp.]